MPSLLKQVVVHLFLAFVFSFILPLNNGVYAKILFEGDFSQGFTMWDVARSSQSSNPSLPCKNLGQNAEWVVLDEKVGIRIHGPSCLTEIVPKDQHWNDEWKFIAVDLDVEFVDGTDKGVLWRYSEGGLKWYGLHFANPTFFEYSRKPYNGNGLFYSNFPLNNGTTYHFRIEI